VDYLLTSRPASLQEWFAMPSSVGETGLVLLVPEADSAVSLWRSAHDPSAAEGMPAHITILYPFISAATLNDQVLVVIAAICREVPPAEFTFPEFGNFPGVLWLRPDTTMCGDLTTRFRAHWPDRVLAIRVECAGSPNLVHG
jgi:hypothetical protein